MSIRSSNRAIELRNLEEVKRLLNNIKSYTNSGLAPIHFLGNYNLNDETSRTIFDLIIENCDINLRSRVDGKTILHLANSVIMVRELLKRNVDLNVQDKKGNTPIMSHIDILTCHYLPRIDYIERLEICNILIKKGANVNLCNYNGDTPIIKILSLLDTRDIIKLISYPQFNINSEDKYGNTILDLAIKPDLIRELIKFPFEPLFLIAALKVHDQTIRDQVYQKWNKMGSDFIEEIVNYSDSYKNNALIVYGLWKYLIQYQRPISEKIYKIFYKHLNSRIILEFNLFSRGEYEKFLFMYIKYGNPIQLTDLQAIYIRYNNNKFMNQIFNYLFFKELPKLMVEFEPFLYILLKPNCVINDVLAEYTPALQRCLVNIQHIGRYCALPRHLAEYFCDNSEDTKIANDLKIISTNAPTLLELSRNVTRLHLAKKYEILYAKELYRVLNYIGIPEGIQEILKFERPLYPQIPNP